MLEYHNKKKTPHDVHVILSQLLQQIYYVGSDEENHKIDKNGDHDILENVVKKQVARSSGEFTASQIQIEQ